MKNKLILFTLFIPVVIACQNTVTINPSSYPNQNNVSTNPSINSTIIPTQQPMIFAGASATLIPSSIPSVMTTTEPNKSILESNMEKILPSSIKPEIPEDELRDIGLKQVLGKVIDYNGKSVPQAKINIYNYSSNSVIPYSKYYFNLQLTSDSNGNFSFKVPENMLIIGSAEKDGYTKRWDDFGSSDTISFDSRHSFKSYLNTSPEIKEIYINNNLITRYLANKQDITKLRKLVYDNSSPERRITSAITNQISENTEIERFKLSYTDKLNIKLVFTTSINKETVEKYIYLESLDRASRYDYKNMNFQWNDNEVIIEFKILKKDKSTKYKLAFSQPFLDIKGNKAYQGEYFAIHPPNIQSFIYTELSENIVFEISGVN